MLYTVAGSVFLHDESWLLYVTACVLAYSSSDVYFCMKLRWGQVVIIIPFSFSQWKSDGDGEARQYNKTDEVKTYYKEMVAAHDATRWDCGHVRKSAATRCIKREMSTQDAPLPHHHQQTVSKLCKAQVSHAGTKAAVDNRQ